MRIVVSSQSSQMSAASLPATTISRFFVKATAKPIALIETTESEPSLDSPLPTEPVLENATAGPQIPVSLAIGVAVGLTIVTIGTIVVVWSAIRSCRSTRITHRHISHRSSQGAASISVRASRGGGDSWPLRPTLQHSRSHNPRVVEPEIPDLCGASPRGDGATSSESRIVTVALDTTGPVPFETSRTANTRREDEADVPELIEADSHWFGDRAMAPHPPSRFSAASSDVLTGSLPWFARRKHGHGRERSTIIGRHFTDILPRQL